MVTSLLSDRKVPDSILASSEGFDFYWRIFPRYMRTIFFLVLLSFVHIPSCVVFGGDTSTLVMAGQEGASNCVGDST